MFGPTAQWSRTSHAAAWGPLCYGAGQNADQSGLQKRLDTTVPRTMPKGWGSHWGYGDYTKYVSGAAADALADEVILICTDSQALVKSLIGGPLTVTDPVVGRVFWHLVPLTMSTRVQAVAIQWVPGHVGLKRMAEVDTFAKEQQKDGAIHKPAGRGAGDSGSGPISHP
jgi:hypothetical protein